MELKIVSDKLAARKAAAKKALIEVAKKAHI